MDKFNDVHIPPQTQEEWDKAINEAARVLCEEIDRQITEDLIKELYESYEQAMRTITHDKQK